MNNSFKKPTVIVFDVNETLLDMTDVKKYKPGHESYQYAAKALGVNTEDMILVVALGWDIAGALAAGMQAAFIERKGQSLYPLANKPQYLRKDLVAIAHEIINSK
jgi:2-haloacid dehalogenase